MSKRTLVILLLAGLALAAIISLTYVTDFNRNNGPRLPPGCAKPRGGFLVIASSSGFNDSIAHGAPTKTWPAITVHQGQNVTIIICDADVQAHGFQITHYFDSSIETLVPGQVLKVSFVADKTGTFQIYCSIFCSVHIYMQSGLLTVTP